MISRRQALVAGAALLGSLPCSPLASMATETAPVCISREGRIRLSCGRILHYNELGDPSGPLVFYFHGTPGSRLEAGLIQNEIAMSGVHLVAVDRPGMGRSTYYSGRRITDWPCDVEALADALGYGGTSFGILAMSGGAPYATVCARMIPHRLTHVAVVSGHSSLGVPGVGLGSVDKAIGLITRRPRLARMGINVISGRLDRKPDKVVARITRDWSAADRELILCNPVYYQSLIDNLSEASYCGSQGLVTDISLLGRHWGFELCQIQGVSVSIWQGGCDRIAPPSTGRYFHQEIAGSEYHFDPAAGHVTMIKWHAPEILARYHNP